MDAPWGAGAAIVEDAKTTAKRARTVEERMLTGVEDGERAARRSRSAGGVLVSREGTYRVENGTVGEGGGRNAERSTATERVALCFAADESAAAAVRGRERSA